MDWVHFCLCAFAGVFGGVIALGEAIGKKNLEVLRQFDEMFADLVLVDAYDFSSHCKGVEGLSQKAW